MDEIAIQIAEQIDQKQMRVKLGTNSMCGAVHVRADENCNSTYSKGISQCSIFKTALENTSDFIKQVNKTLTEADEKAKQSNSGAEILFPELIKNKGNKTTPKKENLETYFKFENK